MVANITSGADFADMVAYALGRDEPDKKAKILCASDGILLTDTEDYRTVARLFEAYSLRGDHQLRDPLKHISLSWHARDGTRLTDELMLKVMREYMKLMGIEDTEYFATRHHDKKHPHLHFMFSRVNRKGEVIDASNERERSRKACTFLQVKSRSTETAFEERTKPSMPSMIKWSSARIKPRTGRSSMIS